MDKLSSDVIVIILSHLSLTDWVHLMQASARYRRLLNNLSYLSQLTRIRSDLPPLEALVRGLTKFRSSRFYCHDIESSEVRQIKRIEEVRSRDSINYGWDLGYGVYNIDIFDRILFNIRHQPWNYEKHGVSSGSIIKQVSRYMCQVDQDTIECLSFLDDNGGIIIGHKRYRAEVEVEEILDYSYDGDIAFVGKDHQCHLLNSSGEITSLPQIPPWRQLNFHFFGKQPKLGYCLTEDNNLQCGSMTFEELNASDVWFKHTRNGVRKVVYLDYPQCYLITTTNKLICWNIDDNTEFCLMRGIQDAAWRFNHLYVLKNGVVYWKQIWRDCPTSFKRIITDLPRTAKHLVVDEFNDDSVNVVEICQDEGITLIRVY